MSGFQPPIRAVEAEIASSSSTTRERSIERPANGALRQRSIERPINAALPQHERFDESPPPAPRGRQQPALPRGPLELRRARKRRIAPPVPLRPNERADSSSDDGALAFSFNNMSELRSFAEPAFVAPVVAPAAVVRAAAPRAPAAARADPILES